MPVDHPDPEGGNAAAAALLARAGNAPVRDSTRLAAATVALRDDGEPLDDRLRAALLARIGDDVDAITRELRLAAARELGEMGATATAAALLDADRSPMARLREAGLIANAELLAEWLGSTALDLLQAAMIPSAPATANTPSLLVRLRDGPDPLIAEAASNLLVAGSAPVAGAAPQLPGRLRTRLIWWIAGALGLDLADPRADHALIEAAAEVVATHDEARRAETLALALAEALAPVTEELHDLLTEALADRRAGLFCALLAWASRMDFGDARAIVVDRDAARLGLLLRAQGCDRSLIARIVVALAEADPARDLERFADHLDLIASVSAEDAAAVFAPLATHPAYREAQRALRGAA